MKYKFLKLFFVFVFVMGSFLSINNLVNAQTSSCSQAGTGPITWSADYSYSYQECVTGTRNCFGGDQCVPDSGAEVWSVNTTISEGSEVPSLGNSIYCGKKATCVPPVPTLSCAKDNNATPSPNLVNTGVKFLATGGTGTYSWDAVGSTGDNGGTDSQIWPQWSTTGSKTVNVTSGTQNASCSVNITATSVNGVCSDPDDHYKCSAGVLGSTTEYSDSYQWWCNGTGGGTNSLCTEFKHRVTSTASTGGSVTPSSGYTSNDSPAVFSVEPSGAYIKGPVTPTSGCPSGTFNGNTYTTVDFSSNHPINCNYGFTFTATSVAPSTPTSLTATAGACGTGTINVSWSAVSGATSYQLRDGTTVIYDGSGTSYSHAGLVAGSSHSYTVRATNASGSSAYSTAVSRTTPIACISMSGTLTPSSSTCSISAGGATCTKLLTWTTTNPVAVSAVTSSTATPSPSTSTNNGSQTFSVPYNNGVASDFYLYNNGVNLASATVYANCTPGTTWDGNSCEIIVNPLPDLTASAPVPNIATVNVARTFSSDISNIGGASTVNSFSNFFQVASAANGGGTLVNLASAVTPALGASLSRTITSPSHTFTTAGTYSVRVCTDKTNPTSPGVIAESDENNNCSAWTNVTVSATTGTISGYHDAYGGTVPASQCRADGWAAYSSDLGLDVNVRILSDGVQVATGVASTLRGDLTGVCTGGTCSYWINLSGLISSGVNHTITAQAQNPGTGAWTTLGGSPKTLNCAAPTTGTLTAPNCTIASGASSCNSALTWSTTNPIGTSNITSNTPSANTLITTGNSGNNFSVSVPYNSRTFFLNNNSVTLVSVSPTATCASGTGWDGTKCAPAASCTDTGDFTGSVTPASVSAGGGYTVACDFGVVSGYIGASVGSSSGPCRWDGWSGKGGTQANFSCNAGSTPGVFNNSCIITYNLNDPYCSRTEAVNSLTVTSLPGVPTVGVCSNPDNHLTPCSSSIAPSAIVNGISSWTWTCPGSNGGAPASCEELKKKPIFEED